jgi:hypothetical protein
MRPNWFRGWVNTGVAFAVFAGALAFYTYTGPADIAWGEGAYYQRRVAQTEIGEGPWDRPLYVMASQPFLRLPWESLIRRTNLASAVFAAGACLFTYLLLKILLQVAPQFIARRVGLVAAASLAVAHTFWFRTVTPGPEVLDALLLAAILYFLVRFANEGRVPHFYLAMGILGLSLANNLMMVFLFPVFAIFVRVVQPALVRDIGMVRARGLIILLVSSAVALAITAFGWAAAGFKIPEEQWSWITFWRSNMMLTWDAPLQQSLLRFGAALLYSFPPWTAFIGLFGLVELFKRQKYVFWLVFPLLLVYSTLAVTLTLAEPMNVYVPAWVLVAIAVGYGWWKVLADGGWRDYVLALLLSLSPVLLYRFAPWAVEKLGEEARVMSFLRVPFEAPFDPLVHLLNPDRRASPSARAFAETSLEELPERCRLVAASREGELLLAPLRYLVEVEKVHPNAVFSTASPSDEDALVEWASQIEEPLFLVGLHPPNPAVESLLDRYHFVPAGHFFRVVPKESVPGRMLTDRDEPTLLAGDWYGFVRPQGYPVSFAIREMPDGSFSGRAVLNEGSSKPLEGNFTRISPIADALIARVTYDDDRIHIHIDSQLSGNRLEGTWQIYEAQHLQGRFVVWKQ